MHGVVSLPEAMSYDNYAMVLIEIIILSTNN